MQLQRDALESTGVGHGEVLHLVDVFAAVIFFVDRHFELASALVNDAFLELRHNAVQPPPCNVSLRCCSRRRGERAADKRAYEAEHGDSEEEKEVKGQMRHRARDDEPDVSAEDARRSNELTL
jgi:hypothetical protein